MEIQFNIKELRKRRKMTITDLAKISGVSKSEISDVENGKKDPRLSTCILLAKSLNVPLTDLFDV